MIDMTNELLISKIYNEILERSGVDADKYEREDAFFGILNDVQKGVDLNESIKDVFDIVHGVEVSDALIDSAKAVCVGFRKE